MMLEEAKARQKKAVSNIKEQLWIVNSLCQLLEKSAERLKEIEEEIEQLNTYITENE